MLQKPDQEDTNDVPNAEDTSVELAPPDSPVHAKRDGGFSPTEDRKAAMLRLRKEALVQQRLAHTATLTAVEDEDDENDVDLDEDPYTAAPPTQSLASTDANTFPRPPSPSVESAPRSPTGPLAEVRLFPLEVLERDLQGRTIVGHATIVARDKRLTERFSLMSSDSLPFVSPVNALTDAERAAAGPCPPDPSCFAIRLKEGSKRTVRFRVADAVLFTGGNAAVASTVCASWLNDTFDGVGATVINLNDTAAADNPAALSLDTRLLDRSSVVPSAQEGLFAVALRGVMRRVVALRLDVRVCASFSAIDVATGYGIDLISGALIPPLQGASRGGGFGRGAGGMRVVHEDDAMRVLVRACSTKPVVGEAQARARAAQGEPALANFGKGGRTLVMVVDVRAVGRDGAVRASTLTIVDVVPDHLHIVDAVFKLRAAEVDGAAAAAPSLPAELRGHLGAMLLCWVSPGRKVTLPCC